MSSVNAKIFCIRFFAGVKGDAQKLCEIDYVLLKFYYKIYRSLEKQSSVMRGVC